MGREKKKNLGDQEIRTLMERPRQRLEEILAPGLAEDPLEHAEQVSQVAGALSEAFEAVGLRCTVVGGSAVEIHAPGIYTTLDIDLVIETARGIHGDPRIRDVFSKLGFKRKGMLWKLGDLAVHTPGSYVWGPDEEVQLEQGSFRVVKKEVVVRDRVVGFKWWKATSDGQQAIDMLAAFGDDLDMSWLRPELESERAWDAFTELRKLAVADVPVAEETLQDLLDRLHGKQEQ